MLKHKLKYNDLFKKGYSKQVKKSGGVLGIFENRINTLWHRLALDLLSQCNLKKKTILEVGCGYGALLVKIAERGNKVIGIDFCSQAMQISREMACACGTSVDLVEGDAENIPCMSSGFDVIVCCETLEHIPNFRKALAEIARCTRTSGYVILTVPNTLHPIGLARKVKSIQPVEHALSFFQLQKEIRKMGVFRIMSVNAKFRFEALERLSEKVPLAKAMGLHIGFVLQKQDRRLCSSEKKHGFTNH